MAHHADVRADDFVRILRRSIGKERGEARANRTQVDWEIAILHKTVAIHPDGASTCSGPVGALSHGAVVEIL